MYTKSISYIIIYTHWKWIRLLKYHTYFSTQFYNIFSFIYVFPINFYFSFYCYIFY